jgi:dTMP kinase
MRGRIDKYRYFERLKIQMANKKSGFFISLEGQDGSGKSTQFKLLCARLNISGFQVVKTREPGGHPLSEKIRNLLLSTEGSAPVPEAELLLFLAARAQHVRDVIQPALQQGKIVVCERFSDSTYAYQVGGRQLPALFVNQGNRFATQGVKPDLTLLYDLPSTTGLKRAYAAKQGHDRMESGPQSFMEGVRRAYRKIARTEPKRVKIIRADQTLEKVTKQSWKQVLEKMKVIKERCHAVS